MSPTCKKDSVVGESTDTTHETTSTIVDHWHDSKYHERFGPLVTVDSDGAPAFRKGVGKTLSGDLPLAIRARYISNDGQALCLLFNLVGGRHGTTPACDTDHLGKRFRARIKSLLGIKIGVFTFTKVDLAAMLARASVLDSEDDAVILFSPDDLMDVLEMVRCLQAIGDISFAPYATFPEEWRRRESSQAEYREIRLLSKVAKTMAILIVGHDGSLDQEGEHVSVKEYLIKCSKLAHMYFVLFRHNKTDFVPAQNYRNWQDTVKNMYVAVSIAKVEGIKDFWWFLNTNKRIEQLFGILRSMRGGNLNFDCLDMRDRIADSILVLWIFAQHPEWDTPSRRLTCSVDRKNTRSWKGDTSVADVDEVECWRLGREEALADLRESRIFTADELDFGAIFRNEPGVDMLRPYRERVGVRAGDRAEYNLVDLQDEGDDEEEEERWGGER